MSSCMLRPSPCIVLCLGALCLAETVNCDNAAHCEDEPQLLEVSLLQASVALKPTHKATVAVDRVGDNTTMLVHRQHKMAAKVWKSGDTNIKTALWLVSLAMVFQGVLCLLLTSCYDSEPASIDTAKKFPHVAALDGWRTAMICFLVFTHLGVFHVCALTNSGLGFFMTIAGFVRVLQKGETNFALRDFRKTVAWTLTRFCPANGFSLILILLIPGMTVRGNPVVFLKQALFLQSFQGGIDYDKLKAGREARFQGNAPLWFLANLLWLTLAYPLLHNIRPRGHWSYPLVVILVLLVVHYLLDSTNPTEPYEMVPMFECDLCPSGQSLVGRAVQFVLGILTAQLFIEMPQEVKQWRHWGWIFDFVWIFTIFYFLWNMRTPNEPSRFAYTRWREYQLDLALLYVMALPMYLLGLFAALGDAESRRVHGPTWHSGVWIRVLEWPPVAKLGRYSLGCYVYHIIPWHLTQRQGGFATIVQQNWKYKWLNDVPMPWIIPLAASWIIAIISEHLVESPIRMYIGYRILSRMQPAAEASLAQKVQSSTDSHIEQKYNVFKAKFSKGWPTRGEVASEDKFSLYGLYKQINEGNVTGHAPWAVQFEARAKWDAWNSRKDMSKEEAMKKYCEESERLIEKYGLTFD